MDKGLLSQYRLINVEKLGRKDVLGEKNFDSLIPQLKDFKGMIEECILIIEKNTIIPSDLVIEMERYVREFVGIANELGNYTFGQEGGSPRFVVRDRIATKVQDFIGSIFKGHDQSGRAVNFLVIYNAIKGFGNENTIDFSQIKKEFNDAKISYEEIAETTSEALKALREETAKITISDYAKIFKDQSFEHSHFLLKKPSRWFAFGEIIGGAEKWFILSMASIGLFIYAIYNFKKWLPLDGDDKYQLISFSITKFFAISLLVYLITFCFKQFSIQKHLYILNKHRENTLNSFRMFIQSVDKDDSGIRNTLMLEVAKAIYEQGKTGYLSEKSQDINSPSIVELTRVIGNK